MKQTATGLAIAGFVIGLIAVFVPIVGIFVSALALALVAIAAYLGEKPLTIATVAITGVKTFFLSPTFVSLRSEYGSALVFAIVGAALAAPLLAMALGGSARAQTADTTNTTGMPGR